MRGDAEVVDALNEILTQTNRKHFGLVTPYLDEVQEKIVANYKRSGYEVVAERHLGISVNFDFSEVTEDQLRDMIRAVARQKPQAITTLCTNLRAAHLVDVLEKELEIRIYDSVSTVVWKALKMVGCDPRLVKGWGRLFAEV